MDIDITQTLKDDDPVEVIYPLLALKESILDKVDQSALTPAAEPPVQGLEQKFESGG